MAKTIMVDLKIKQNFQDKETKVSYKKGRIYSFTEKRAEELLKNPYLVEKVSTKEVKDVEETADSIATENTTK